MRVLAKLKNNPYLVWALVVAVLNMAAIFLIFGFQKYGDTEDYLKVLQWLKGQDAQTLPWRLLRPLSLFFALPFEFLGPGAGIIFQNIIFYLLASYLIFRITDLIFNNKKQAFFASLFFVTTTPMIESGLAYLTDMAAWFFYLLSLLLTLLYLKKKQEALITINGLLSGLAILTKESGGLGALFFGLMILFSKDFSLGQKLAKILKFALYFVLPVAVWYIFMFYAFQYTFFKWYQMGRPGLRGESVLLMTLRYLGQLFRVLGVLWPLFFVGLWRELKEKHWERLKIFTALLPASLSFLLWTIEAAGRSLFIFAPFGILLASQGLIFLESKLKKKIAPLVVVSLLLVLLVFNYSFCWLNPRVAFINRLAEFLGIIK